jgi:DNA invertase Pin-like site-specific DNA recombinase
VRSGDTVVVYSIDRLARDLRDLQTIIQQLNDKEVSVEFVSEKLAFSGAADAFSKLQLQMMGAFAEFERSIIKQRQAEGIAKAKERGVYKGRKKQIDDNKIVELTAQGKSQHQVAEIMGITRMSVYRCLKKQRSTTKQPA